MSGQKCIGICTGLFDIKVTNKKGGGFRFTWSPEAFSRD